MQQILLFKKPNIYFELTAGNISEKDRVNMPQYNSNLTLYKGIDNTIQFSIRNHDRKKVVLADNQYMVFKMVNQPRHQEIIKDLEAIDVSTGKYKVVITKDELNDVDSGDFVAHVVIKNSDVTSITSEEESGGSSAEGDADDILYSGQDWFPLFGVEVKPNRMDIIEESKKLTPSDFMSIPYTDPLERKNYKKYVSSIIQSNVTSSHTFQIGIVNFVGTIYIQGTMNDNPTQEDFDWFDIAVKHYDDMIDSDTILVNESLNCKYVRVVYTTDDDGSIIDFVLYRN